MSDERVWLEEGKHELALHTVELFTHTAERHLTRLTGVILRSTALLTGAEVEFYMRADDRVGGMLLEAVCWATGSETMRNFADRVDQILFDIKFGAAHDARTQPMRDLRDERLTLVIEIERKFDPNTHAKRFADSNLCRRARVLRSYE